MTFSESMQNDKHRHCYVTSRFLFIDFVVGDAGISNTVHSGVGSTVQ